MNDPMIICPSCKTEIKLTESLAAPLLESTRKQYEEKVAQKEAEISQREGKIRQQQTILDEAQKKIDQRVEKLVAEKIESERQIIKAQEAKKANLEFTDKITKTEQEKTAMEELLREKNAKLVEAQNNELSLRKERQKLQEEKEQFALEMQRALDNERTNIRTNAQKDADEKWRLKNSEHEKTISDLQGQLQNALRKAEQGSQQLQGEVQELELETLLRTKFPQDIIEPVPKGECGGDILHYVNNTIGKKTGTILWESKRTKNWSDSWLSKLKGDQRKAGADIGIIISQTLPKNIEVFDFIDGIWIVNPQYLIPVTIVLRQSLMEISSARQAREGQLTKMEMIYQYLTGPLFRHRVEAIIEKFDEMKEDLIKEQKIITKHWAKREEQIRCVLESTAGMYGDLQGIAGKSFQEIEGLDIKMLDNQEDNTIVRNTNE